MRRAGLVAYVNRKNRAAGARTWRAQGKETLKTTKRARESDNRASVVRKAQ
jgi:hypothetical protein